MDVGTKNSSVISRLRLLKEEYIGGVNAWVNIIFLIVFTLIHLAGMLLSVIFVFCLCCYDLLSYLKTNATDTNTPQYRGLPLMTKFKHLDLNCNSGKQACR